MGIGVLGLIDLYLRINFNYSHFKILNSLICFTSLGGIFFIIKDSKCFHKPKKDTMLAYIFIILFGLILLFRSLIMPVEAWDSIAIHTLKVKRLIYQPDFTQYFGIPEYANPHQDYPILIHLTESWLAQDSNSEIWQDYPVKIISPIFTCLIILLIYNRIRRNYNSLITFLIAFSFGFCPIVLEYAVVNLMDIPLSLFFLITVLALEEYDVSKQTEWITLALGFSIMSAFVKNEGIPFLLITFFLSLNRIYKNRKSLNCNQQVRIGIKLSIVLFLLWIEWPLLLLINRVQESNITKNGIVFQNLLDVERFRIIFTKLLSQIFNFKHWSLILLTSFLSVILGVKIKHNLFARYFIITMLIYCMVYGLTSEELTWHLNTSLDRILLQVSALGFISFFILLPLKTDPLPNNNMTIV